MGSTKEKPSLVIPDKLASNQAIILLMDELRRLKDMELKIESFNKPYSKQLTKQINEVELALELLVIYLDR
jgi:hypothetical protein